VQADWDSPVDVLQVEFWLNGNWYARGGAIAGDERAGQVIVGLNLQVGTTYTAQAKFFTGEYLVDLVARRFSDPFTVTVGEPCPGG